MGILNDFRKAQGEFILYHATPKENLPLIMEQGLHAGSGVIESGGGRSPHRHESSGVYLAGTPEQAEIYKHDDRP